MKKVLLIFLGLCLNSLAFSQTNNKKLIELGKAYKNFMFQNEPNKDDLKEIKMNVPGELKTASEFIVQTITTNNKLLSQVFLERSNENVLKQIYIIRAIDLNSRKEDQIENNILIDSLEKVQISDYELVDNYYDLLFASIGNKNQPFNFGKVNFKINELKLKDDTEKGIFFLKCMDLCGTNIWGYMNVVKPANTAKAMEYIKKFPKFNGRPYYQYTDFYFPDFRMKIVENEDSQSYKSYYLNKYYATLLYNLICLNEQNGSEKDKNDLLLGSILKERKLYKYTKYKETLENIFEEQKKD